MDQNNNSQDTQNQNQDVNGSANTQEVPARLTPQDTVSNTNQENAPADPGTQADANQTQQQVQTQASTDQTTTPRIQNPADTQNQEQVNQAANSAQALNAMPQDQTKDAGITETPPNMQINPQGQNPRQSQMMNSQGQPLNNYPQDAVHANMNQPFYNTGNEQVMFGHPDLYKTGEYRNLKEEDYFRTEGVKKATIMRNILMAQPKVMTMIPLMPGEPANSYQFVQINGYTMYVKKGIFVPVPQQVAEMIAESYNLTYSIGQDMLISGNTDKENRLRG